MFSRSHYYQLQATKMYTLCDLRENLLTPMKYIFILKY